MFELLTFECLNIHIIFIIHNSQIGKAMPSQMPTNKRKYISPDIHQGRTKRKMRPLENKENLPPQRLFHVNHVNPNAVSERVRAACLVVDGRNAIAKGTDVWKTNIALVDQSSSQPQPTLLKSQRCAKARQLIENKRNVILSLVIRLGQKAP
jgi:hypothetical protein